MLMRFKDIKTLLRLLALGFAKGDTKKAENYLLWAEDNATNDEPDIEILLTPGERATSQLKQRFIVEYIVKGHIFPVEKAQKRLKDMPYSEFLKTPYWKAIRAYVKDKAGNKCSICGSKTRLQIHHKTYAHHGDELHHLQDLVCVCEKCHNQIHKIEPEEKPQPKKMKNAGAYISLKNL